MDPATCGSCAHYRQHYAFDRRKIFRVYCGHCTCLKAKMKRPDSKICGDYIQAEPDEKAFVTREYLSKALLNYMMDLELLPEIHEAESDTETQSADGYITPK